MKFNKKIQNKLDKDIKNYHDFSEKFSSIKIEIIPAKNKYGKFINYKANDCFYTYIYFNDNN